MRQLLSSTQNDSDSFTTAGQPDKSRCTKLFKSPNDSGSIGIQQQPDRPRYVRDPSLPIIDSVLGTHWTVGSDGKTCWPKQVTAEQELQEEGVHPRRDHRSIIQKLAYACYCSSFSLDLSLPPMDSLGAPLIIL